LDLHLMPISGPAPLTVSFADRSTGDVLSRAWTFGDATTSTDQYPSHEYTVAGTYVVTLTVTTPLGVLSFTDVVYVGVAWVAYSNPTPAYATYPGADPQIVLKVSNDAGRNWITQQGRSAGKFGEYSKRVRWDRLGSGRRRVYEVVATDPIPWRIMGAYMNPVKEDR
jgi:PKD repeat protein